MATHAMRLVSLAGALCITGLLQPSALAQQPKPEKPSQQAGVGIRRNCRYSPSLCPEFAPQGVCEKGVRELRSEYLALGNVLSKITDPTQSGTRKELQRQGDDVAKQWAALKAECARHGIDIGALDGNQMPLQTGPKAPGDQEEEDRIQDVISQIDNDKGLEDSFGNSLLMLPALAVGGAVDGLVEYTAEEASDMSLFHTLGAALKGAVETTGEHTAIELTAEQLQQARESLSKDSERATSSPMTADRSPTRRLAQEAMSARENEIRALRSYRNSYMLYRKGQADKKPEEMMTRSQDMVKFAQQAREQSRKYSAAHYTLHRVILTEVEEKRARDPRGFSVKTQILVWQQEIKESGFSPDVQEQFQRAHVSKQQIERFRKEALALTPNAMQSRLSKVQAWVHGVDAVRAELVLARSDAEWPAPSELRSLNLLVANANRSLFQAEQARRGVWDRVKVYPRTSI